MSEFSKKEAMAELAKREIARRSSAPKRTLKEDIPAIASEFISGALADAPRNIPRRPLATTIGGPSLAQMQSGANIPTLLSNLLGGNRQIPFPDESRQLPQILPQPQTQTGKVLGAGANIIGGLVGLPGGTAAKSIKGTGEAIASATAGPKKVKQIQQAFGGFHKAATTKFGQVIKEGEKKLIAKGGVIPSQEGKAIFSVINDAPEEIAKQLPAKAKLAAKNTENLSFNDLLRKKVNLKRSLSAAERSGRIVTDRSRVIQQTIKNIDGTLKANIPGIEQANKEYSIFMRTKELIENFEPQFARLPDKFGTSEGQKFLRGILRMTDEEIDLLKRFENLTHLKIVGPAKTAARVAQISNILGKAIPLVVGYTMLKKSGADKALFNLLDVAN